MKTFLCALVLCLFATATNAAEKTYAQMSADADGWLYSGAIVMLGLAVLALVAALIEVITTNSRAKHRL